MRVLASGVIRVLCPVVAFLACQLVFASDWCDALVIDQTGKISSTEKTVASAANQLVSRGADVRVRIVSDIGQEPTLDKFIDQIRKNCPSWQALDGGMKNNLIVLAVSLGNRKTGLYYGSQWSSVLGGQWTSIQADEMNPRFRDGDFSGGVVAGLKRISVALSAPVGTASRNSTTHVYAATDLSGLWTVFGWLVALVFLGVVGYYGYSFYNERYRMKQHVRDARQRAKAAKAKCSSAILSMGEAQFAVAEARIRQGLQGFSDAVVQGVLDKVFRAKGVLAKAHMDFSALGRSESDPDQSGLSTDGYNDIAQSFECIANSLQSVSNLLREAEESIARMRRLIEEAPAKVSEAEGGALNVFSVFDQQSSDTRLGVETLVKVRNDVEALLRQARSSLSGGNLLEASDMAGKVMEAIDELKTRFNRLLQVKQSISDEVQRTWQSIQLARTLIDAHGEIPSHQDLAGTCSVLERRFAVIRDDMVSAYADIASQLMAVRQEAEQISSRVQSEFRKLREEQDERRRRSAAMTSRRRNSDSGDHRRSYHHSLDNDQANVPNAVIIGDVYGDSGHLRQQDRSEESTPTRTSGGSSDWGTSDTGGGSASFDSGSSTGGGSSDW